MNMVVLIGRLVRDPSYSEVETEKGKYHIASFYLAVPRNFNKGVNYIKITTFGKQADFARDYLTKGKRVAILGELMIGILPYSPYYSAASSAAVSFFFLDLPEIIL